VEWTCTRCGKVKSEIDWAPDSTGSGGVAL
jgi:hypothetical protein